MKNATLLSIIIAFTTLQSCKDNAPTQKIPAKTESQKIIPTDCFTAIYEKDTLRLDLDTAKPDAIVGNMVMKIYGIPEKVGTVAGKYHGDTLFASYTFSESGNKKVVFKNPLALLKKGNQLILGNGEIETTMGASYFIKGKSIDFELVKYKFTPSDCPGH
jgi:hypothetical protein